VNFVAPLRRTYDHRESPVKVWREKRGLSQRELAEKAVVSASYLAEIETGKKPGSAEALRKLSRVLAISMENLMSHPPMATRRRR
jgi:transcriptional regulator with XRE-family HTH domain